MVRGQIPRTKYLDSIQVGELNAMVTDVDLYPGAPPLRIVFRFDPGSVRGTVERCEAARVVLIPQEETLRSEALMRGAVCDSSGRYDVAGLRPGDYYAFAFDHIGYPTGLLDRTLVNALLPFAARAQVRIGDATSLDSKVT